MRFTVGTADLRQALIAVAPHADPDGEFLARHRVRLDVGVEWVTVSATQGFTLGHALVPMEDNLDGELGEALGPGATVAHLPPRTDHPSMLLCACTHSGRRHDDDGEGVCLAAGCGCTEFRRAAS